MLPISTTIDMTDGCVPYVKLGSDSSTANTCFVKPAYLTHIILSQARAMVSDSYLTRGWPSFHPVTRVVSVRAEVQMLRVYTRAIITLMKNVQVREEGAVCEFIRNAMSTSATPAKPNHSVTARARALPNPTVRGLLNLIPESLFNWYTCHVSASLQVLANPRQFIAARGFSVPNYNTKGGLI